MFENLLWVVAAVALLCALARGNALCAEVAGTVVDRQGNDVGSITIIAADPTTGKIMGEAVTNASGKYQIAGLGPGTYDFSLDPGTTRFMGGKAVSYVSEDGLTIDWKVSKGAAAIALATPGIGGLAGANTALAVFGAGIVLLGGIFGGLAAAGAFSGAGVGQIASPSL